MKHARVETLHKHTRVKALSLGCKKQRKGKTLYSLVLCGDTVIHDVILRISGGGIGGKRVRTCVVVVVFAYVAVVVLLFWEQVHGELGARSESFGVAPDAPVVYLVAATLVTGPVRVSP